MAEQIVLIIVILLLSLIIFVQWMLHQKERTELLNRIMARDLGEYRAFSEDGVPIGKRENHVQQAIRRAEAMNQQD